MDIDIAILLAIAISALANFQPHLPAVSARWLTHLSSQEMACASTHAGCFADTKPSRWARH
ncbi:MAG TPA: hypothetical protein VFB13_11965 [Reyranella sp.]|nr:hypothetical protein [Reyranella sp.]